MIYELLIPQFTKMLRNLVSILDEAEKYSGEKKFDSGVLLQSRLAPDQFNLLRQLQVACDTAKLGVARLSDTEQTLVDIRARISRI